MLVLKQALLMPCLCHADKKGLMSIINANEMRACKLVRKCLNKDICGHFQNYFTLMEHDKETRSVRCDYRILKKNMHENHFCTWVLKCTLSYL